jgi:hypothetical protein
MGLFSFQWPNRHSGGLWCWASSAYSLGLSEHLPWWAPSRPEKQSQEADE